MGSAYKANSASTDLTEQGNVADGIFAALDALKVIARAANLPEIYNRLDEVLTGGLDDHVEKLRSQLEAMQRPKS
ncbi:hypothetical protein [Asticcacaulis taihuensis]|uniref:hypothetical protein n=1 Tax=Asticcacaulis taihuensis TaxID=260084 RepID=UPI003F7B481A